jgi:Zn-dependent membrane protease YugP
MGGQGPKKVRIKKKYRKYANSAQASISGTDIVHVAKEIAPVIAIVSGHQEIAAGITALADAYSTYQKTHSAEESVYKGVSAFVINTTPGLIASWAVGSAEDQLGLKIDKAIRPALEYGVEKGIEFLEERTFEGVERRIWPK